MENLNVFVDKKEINELYNKEKYKNCMDKKYFEYIVSNGKIDYIDKYLGNSKNKNIVESLLLKNNTAMVIDKLSVTVEGKRYIGELENLEIDDIEVSEKIVEVYHDQILTKGIFALIKLEENIDNKYPYYIEEIEILEDTDIKLEDYKEYFLEKVKNNKDKWLEEAKLYNFNDQIDFSKTLEEINELSSRILK
jgi:predicted ATP-dependent Lon-type protease